MMALEYVVLDTLQMPSQSITQTQVQLNRIRTKVMTLLPVQADSIHPPFHDSKMHSVYYAPPFLDCFYPPHAHLCFAYPS